MRIKMLEMENKVQEIDDMRIKMIEMENKVQKLELKVGGFPDAIEVSSEAGTLEHLSTRLGKYDFENVILGRPVYRKADTEYRIFRISTMSYS